MQLSSNLRSDPLSRPWPLLAALLMTALVLATAGPAVAISGQTTAAENVADEVRDSVVTVYTWTEGGAFSPGRTGREPTGSGSGWVYNEDGIVVTNAHVVRGVDEVKVLTTGGVTIPAEVIGSDWYQDVAVLRLNPDNDDDLPPPATVGNSATVEPGDEVVAIGTPGGRYANTVTVGLIYATGVSLDTGAGYSLNQLIRHGAALASGNSGGPLFSTDGEVIGMNTASVHGRDDDQPAISFAIDGNTAVALVEEILANGAVDRPWLGVQSRVTEAGVTVVSDVVDDSPAAEAEIESGDEIVAVDGQPVGRGMEFIDLLYMHETGDTIELTIRRGDDETQVEVELYERSSSS